MSIALIGLISSVGVLLIAMVWLWALLNDARNQPGGHDDGSADGEL